MLEKSDSRGDVRAASLVAAQTRGAERRPRAPAVIGVAALACALLAGAVGCKDDTSENRIRRFCESVSHDLELEARGLDGWLPAVDWPATHEAFTLCLGYGSNDAALVRYLHLKTAVQSEHVVQVDPDLPGSCYGPRLVPMPEERRAELRRLMLQLAAQFSRKPAPAVGRDAGDDE